MSFDLMVFETAAAPKKKDEFMEWYDRQTEREEDHDYMSAAVASPALQDWYMEMKETFPPMDGDDAPDMDSLSAEAEDFLTDYSIGREVIYAAFSWGKAGEAYELACKLAQKHGVGFFDVSGDGGIILPDGTLLE